MKEKLPVINCQLSVIRKLFSVHCSLFTVFMLTACFLLPAVVSASTVDDVVDLIQKKYSEIQDIQGKFFQTSYLKDLDRVERYEGVFFIKKPFSMKWAYSKPRDEEVIIRDTDTWIYKKSERQALKTTFSRDAYNQIPITLLNSLGNLKSDFNITMIKEGTLELKPKRQMGFIKKIDLEVSSGDFPVKSFRVYDIHNNKVAILVKDVKLNSGLKDSFFTFKVPPGVELFDLNP